MHITLTRNWQTIYYFAFMIRYRRTSQHKLDVIHKNVY